MQSADNSGIFRGMRLPNSWTRLDSTTVAVALGALIVNTLDIKSSSIDISVTIK